MIDSAVLQPTFLFQVLMDFMQDIWKNMNNLKVVGRK